MADERNRLQRFVQSNGFETIAIVATYLAVFSQPLLGLVEQTQGQLLPIPTHEINRYIDITAAAFFLFETVMFTFVEGLTYLKSPAAFINVLAVGAIGAGQFAGNLGVANPRILRIIRTVRTVARINLTQKAGAASSVLGADALRRMNNGDTWYALLLLGMMSVYGTFSVGKYAHWLDAVKEIAIYIGFIIAVKWKAKYNERQIEEVFIIRLNKANQKIIQNMQDIPGLEDAHELIENHAEEEIRKGNEMNEIVVMVDAINMIITNLQRFISRRTFQEAKGKIVIPTEDPVALMFTDVEGFSNIAESLQEDIIPTLKTYFGEMNREVHGFGGDIDKFIGDALFAYFHDPNNPPNAVNEAFDCTLNMYKICDALYSANEEWGKIFSKNTEWEQFKRIRTRFGLHWGKVIAGPIGSIERADSTLIGDNVNLAARMETLCKKYQTYILLTDTFYYHLSSDRQAKCRKLDCVTVAGRDNSPLDIFCVDVRPLPAHFLAKYTESLESYIAGDWHVAWQGFVKAQDVLRLEGFDEDGPSHSMVTRIKESNSFWHHGIDYLAKRIPSVITDELILTISDTLSNEPIKPPIDWQGYWQHEK